MTLRACELTGAVPVNAMGNGCSCHQFIPFAASSLAYLLLAAMAPGSGHQGVKLGQLQLRYERKLMPVQACCRHLSVKLCVYSLSAGAGHQ